MDMRFISFGSKLSYGRRERKMTKIAVRRKTNKR